MRGSLKSLRLRVERVAEAMAEESAGDAQEELIAKLLEGRQRVARAANSGEELPKLSYEEIRARARELQAQGKAEGIIR